MKRIVDAHRFIPRSAGAIALVLAAVACGSSDEGSATAPPAATPPPAPQAPLAEQISVDDVAVYQAVKAQLVREGEIVEKPNAPVIANRPAVIRVFVKARRTARPTIEAELVLKTPGKPDLVLRDGGKRVVNELDDDELGTTMNFPVPADALQAETTYVFRAAAGKLDGAADVLTFPSDGVPLKLGVKTSSQTVRVKFVPITFEDEGVERPADMSSVQLYKDTIYSMYPVANVEVSVREQPLKWAQPVQSNGGGWDKLLSTLMQLRRSDAPAQDVYYVGVFNPRSSLAEFCASGGCVLGLAPQATERDLNMRVALVLGYDNRGAGDTVAHELAHAMGRGHAPCGSPAGIDDEFPYGNASIGVGGYDLLTKKWVSPSSRAKDFMSYCGPTWVSDYTYNAIFERMTIVAQQEIDRQKAPATTSTGGAAGGASAQVMQSFLVDKNGVVEPGPELDTLGGAAEGDEKVAVTYEGPGDAKLASAVGVVRYLPAIDGRIIVAPRAPKAALRARLGGIGVTALRSVSYSSR